MAIGRAVNDGKLNWNTRLKDVLPDLKISDKVLRDETTNYDILAHRTGISIGNFYVGSETNILISHKDSFNFINYQVPIKPFRQE